ncbi:MAG: peroxide stress protein YaaA, partial [Planctomycetota bacterium]
MKIDLGCRSWPHSLQDYNSPESAASGDAAFRVPVTSKASRAQFDSSHLRRDPTAFMLILLSPAKTLDFETEESLSSVVRRAGTTPDFLQDSAELVALLKKLSPKRLGSLMSISDDLAQLNHGRYQDWTSPMPDSGTRPSVLAFKGDVYLGLRAESLTDK